MKVVGEVHDFHPAALVRFVLRAMRVGWMWAGVGMMTLAFFSLLAMLSFENVSFVVPVTALSYAAGALARRCSCTNASARNAGSAFSWFASGLHSSGSAGAKPLVHNPYCGGFSGSTCVAFPILTVDPNRL